MARPLKPDDKRPVSVRPSAIKLLQSGTPLRYDTSLHNLQVAEIDQLRAELSHLQARHHALWEGVRAPVLYLASTGFIEQANRPAESLLGGGRLVNQRMGRFIHQNCVEAYETAFEATLLTAKPQTCDLTLITRSSPRTHCAAHLRRFSVGTERKLVLTIVDKTEITEASQTAAQASLDLRTVIQRSPYPMMVLGTDGYIRLGNAAVARLLGANRSLEDEALELWIVDQSRSAFRDALYRRTVDPLAVEIVRRGEVCRVQIQLTPVQWRGEPCAVAVFEDRGEDQRQAHMSEREGRLASLGLLVAGVAHEVNNPLAFVVPNVHEVANALRSLDPGRMVGGLMANDAYEMLEEASQGLQRIANITRDLKSFHRTDGGLEALNLNEVVVDTLRLADNRLRQSAVLRRDLGAIPPVKANRGRLGQVVLNLLLNAADAMPSERLQIDNRISVRTWLERGVIHLEVGDNGKGIDQRHLPNLFDPFFTTRQAGTGLGLAICANIVRDMGGWFEVTSEVGSGTKFIICFPSDGDGRPPRRVLIVSEEPLLIRGTEREMSRRYAVVQACGGFEAIRLLKNDDAVDAIVCARHMKDGSGDDVYAWLATHRSDLTERFVFLDDATKSIGLTTGSEPLSGSALSRLLDSMVT